MDIEKLKRELQNEGFVNIYEWTDAPNTKYPEHKHKGKVSFYITDGSISMNILGIEHRLKTRDRIDIPVDTLHTAKVGSQGCSYIVGEEIKGDS